MGLKKGGQPPQEQMYETQKKQGGSELFILKMFRGLIMFIFGATILGVGMSGLMAILGNRIDGNPFIGLTLFFAVPAAVLFAVLLFLTRKINEYY